MHKTTEMPDWQSFRTKADLQQAAVATFEPLRARFTPGRAGLELGATGAIHNEAIALMEAFARPLWGLVPHAAGGGDSDLWPLFLQGIANGTDPEHEEYWGDFGTKDQRMVEQAALGLGLALAPHRLWEPLNERQRDNLFRWLNQINLVDRSNPNNWLMFTVLVNIGLMKVGLPYNRAIMNEYLDTIDSYYLDDGWYADGKTDQRDYYIPFAMHYYTLIYAKLMEGEDPGRAARYRERAKRFAEQFVYWFAEDGSSLPFGRSLTYRFAQASFWSALAYAGVEVFTPGVLKGIVMRHLRWWFRQPIFAPDGLLSIGYAYPNLIMGENYNAPGSPYWAYKTFLVLALPDDDPFWLAEEEPLPALGAASAQPHARMIVCRPEGDRHVTALASGQMANFDMAHSAAKYAKFAYSTLFGFSVPKAYYGLVQGAYDSTLALSECDDHYRVRRFCEEFAIAERYVYSRWLPWRDVEVRTWLVPAGVWHVRIHRIATGRPLDAAEGGFAVRRPADFAIREEDAIMTVPCGIAAILPWGVSGIANVEGHGQAEMIYPDANTNVLHPRTMIPTLTTRLEPGEHWLVSAVIGATHSEENVRRWARPPRVERAAGGSAIVVRDPESGEIWCEAPVSRSRTDAQ
ncbi:MULTISPECIES: DUF2264 domain-containing protein [unclassified Paenibacillus]|uniref:DUF2264 domain-containing protein n=1 Tax=unclassified Paenibacillus TaxID=185978 RepID=UPI001E5842E5|nr:MULTISPECIES: DUF2264 domain-containing protein [unclassified Paenibacillus]CAH0120369.1 hypothetical protein PAE9249_02888 [Paenibacillus sp. CECT 9249]